MLPLPTAQTYEEGFPLEARVPGFRDSAVPVGYGTGADTICFSTPSMGQRNQYQSQGAAQAPSTSQTGHIGQGQSAGRGQA